MKCLELVLVTVVQLALLEAFRMMENRILKCNETISSKDKKNGTIKSPLHLGSYPSGIVCEYMFIAEVQERVQLRFTSMDLYYSAGDPDDPYECPSQDSITVYTYVDGKEEDLGQYCGKKHPYQLMSSGQKMKVVFKSEDTQKDSNSGFRIDYSFRTDYGVQGNGVQDNREECIFKFNSTRASEGIFTSPNYPGLYPSNMECQYIFNGKPKEERVVIEFEDFDLHKSNRCDDPTESDYVKFSNFLNTDDRKMKRYCGNRQSYAPVMSDAAFFRVTFKSNNKYDSKGFRGHYKFKRRVEYMTPSPSLSQSTEGVSSGSSSHISLAVSITTIILFCESVIDHFLKVF